MDKEKITIKDLFVGPAKNSMVEFFRSLFVGGVAFVSDYGVMLLLKELGGMSALGAVTLSFVVGVVVNYLMSNFWAFKESNVKNGAVRFLIFTAIATVGLLLTDAIVWLFEGPMAAAESLGGWLRPERYYMVGKIVATVVVFFWNFFSRKLILYRGNKDEKAGDAKEAGGGEE